MTLEFAVDHDHKLQALMRKAMLDEKYKYYFYSSYFRYDIDVPRDSWNHLQMVSVKGNEIVGLLGAYIDRETRNVTDLYAINFHDINYTFSKDFRSFLTDLFDKFYFNKISFKVIKGNEAEKMYDKYIEKYNGRVVGYRKNEVMLLDGKYYDDKIYEITRNEYLKFKNT
ncbi:hypothetical protein [Lysinibacillus sp. Bpr_S20]|uniref:hypothetical protein n=1 Tax=Lysinibacillus sp. Bpr_S20 TaxID=2933964 RepID=UPI00201313F6|nr:hypothetical protein [Lysinibacillus sp. Bpr_S20]MCL1700775.1 hypothetical protein [Lysinibacillus sp. Bpr_S20]